MHVKLVLLVLFVCLNISSIIAQSRKLEVIGTVVGRDKIFGHIYNSNAVNRRLLIVRINEKLKGKIDSKFILIDYLWHLKDEKTPYRNNNATQWKFSLTREKDCDSTLEKLQFSYFMQDKKITGIFPQVERTWGIEFEPLPFEQTLPCYQLESKNLSQVEAFVTDSYKIPRTDIEFFVLKNSILVNLQQTPLEILILKNGLFSFVNKSNEIIVNYTLGCVTEKDDEMIITHKGNPEETNLAANNTILTPKSYGGVSNYSDQLKTCYDKKSRFSVVEVSFQNKTIWQAK